VLDALARFCLLSATFGDVVATLLTILSDRQQTPVALLDQDNDDIP
jgi:hypothetical protein